MKKKIIPFIFLIVILFGGCSAYKTLRNISYLKYKIKGISDFSFLGINFSNIENKNDLGFSDISKITVASAIKKLPVSFTLNIIVRNTNKNAYETTDIKIAEFPFTLFFEDKKILEGNINKPVIIPGKNDSTLFPVNVSFNLADVLGDLSLNEILHLILELGGKSQNLSNLKIEAKPKLILPWGFVYEKEVTISNDAFNN